MHIEIIFNNFFQLFLLLNIFVYSLQEVNSCPKDSPIKYNNSCVSRFCNQLEYNNKTCILDNEIVRIQWLNKIVKVSKDLSYKYANPICKDNILIIFSYPYDNDSTNDIY